MSTYVSCKVYFGFITIDFYAVHFIHFTIDLTECTALIFLVQFTPNRQLMWYPTEFICKVKSWLTSRFSTKFRRSQRFVGALQVLFRRPLKG